MAEKTLNTRILLRYDSYANWTTNNPVLKAGEMAIAYIQTGDTQEVNSVTAPQILIKVGDGTTAYNDLPFTSAKAADVHTWAKAATKPEYQASEIKGLANYIAGEIQDTDTQYKMVKVNDYQYKLMSKAKGDTDYTTEVATIDIPNDTAAIEANTQAITALEGLVGEQTVAIQIANAIAALNLGTTYETKTDAAAKLTEAKGHADNLNTAMSTRVEALESMFGDGEGTVEAQIESAVAAEKSEREKAVAAIQGEVDALETKHGEDKAALETSIAAAKKAGEDAQTHSEGVASDLAAEVTAREQAVAGVQEAVDAIEADYLKAADKTELAGDIADNANAISALQGLVGDTQVSAQISAVTNPIAADVATIKGDYLKAADKTALENADKAQVERIAALEGTITGLSGAMHFKGVKAEIPTNVSGYADGDVIIVGEKEYVFNDGAFVEFGDVSAEGDRLTALEKHKTDYEAKVGTLETKMAAVEGKAAANESAIATKAAQADLDAAEALIAANDTAIKANTAEIAKKADKTAHDALAGRVTITEGKITTLEGEMDVVEGRAAALEQKVGDETVSAQINAAIAALKIGDYAKAADLTAAVARVAQNEKDIDALEGRATAVEGRATALETEVAKKANDADLAVIAKTGNVNDLVQTEGDVLIFDCGTSV